MWIALLVACLVASGLGFVLVLGAMRLARRWRRQRQQQRLAWRLYRQMVPERLRTLLDTRLDKLLRMQDPDAQPLSTDGCYPLARY